MAPFGGMARACSTWTSWTTSQMCRQSSTPATAEDRRQEDEQCQDGEDRDQRGTGAGGAADVCGLPLHHRS